MQSPAQYTLLGVAVSLGLLSLVGLGGVTTWAFWETQNNSGPADSGASAQCQSSANTGDPSSVGLDLVLSQAIGADSVVVTGVVSGPGVVLGSTLRLGLSSETSCSPLPTQTTQTTAVSPVSDGYAPVGPWTLAGAQLDGTGGDITGDVMVLMTSSGVPVGCCVVASLPGGGGIVSRRSRPT